jgi:hypothetical protein
MHLRSNSRLAFCEVCRRTPTSIFKLLYTKVLSFPIWCSKSLECTNFDKFSVLSGRIMEPKGAIQSKRLSSSLRAAMP